MINYTMYDYTIIDKKSIVHLANKVTRLKNHFFFKFVVIFIKRIVFVMINNPNNIKK